MFRIIRKNVRVLKNNLESLKNHFNLAPDWYVQHNNTIE